MTLLRRNPWLRVLAVAAALVVLVVGGFGTYLAGQAGRLPFQEEPTRIAITPFADIPGFGAPTRAASPAATPADQSFAVPTAGTTPGAEG